MTQHCYFKAGRIIPAGIPNLFVATRERDGQPHCWRCGEVIEPGTYHLPISGDTMGISRSCMTHSLDPRASHQGPE